MTTTNRLRAVAVGLALIIGIPVLPVVNADAARRTNHPLHPCGVPYPGPAPAWMANDYWHAAAEFGVSYRLVYDIAAGETGHNHMAKNPRSSASGTFQHLRRYWPSRVAAFNRWARAHGRETNYGNIWNNRDQARMTAFMLSGRMGRTATKAWNCPR